MKLHLNFQMQTNIITAKISINKKHSKQYTIVYMHCKKKHSKTTSDEDICIQIEVHEFAVYCAIICRD